MQTVYGEIKVEEFSVEQARLNDFVFLAVSGEFAFEHARAISEGEDGAIVIDNSSAFRYMDDIPLVVSQILCRSYRSTTAHVDNVVVIV